MTDNKPEALRLAEMLTADEWPGSVTLVSYARECVAELRRLHAENERLAAAPKAARGAAQAAPADQRNTKTHDLLSTMIGLFMGQRHKIGYKDNSVIAKVVAEAVEHLKDWPYPDAAPAPVAEGFDEWLEKQFEFRNYYYNPRGPGLMAVPFARRAYEAGRAQAAQPEGGAK